MRNVFCVRPGWLNVGDDVIGFAVRGLLGQAFGPAVNLLSVPAAGQGPDGWIAGLGPRAVHEMNQYGQGVVVGSGNLYENGRLDLDPQALERLQPPLMLFGLSHGRIYDHRHRLAPRTDSMPDDRVRALNRRATRSLVRDEATLAHLRSLGVDDAVLVGCPTLLLSELPGAAGAPGLEPGGPLVSVRNPQLMNVPLADQARVPDELRRIVTRLEAAGMGRVRLLCHDKRDIAFAESLGDLEYVYADDVATYLGLIRSAAVLVTFRIHAFVPALSLGIPAINLSYDERSLSLVGTLGLADWDIDFVREPDVIGAVADRLGRLGELEALVAAQRPRWAGYAAAMRAELDSFVEDVRAYAAG